MYLGPFTVNISYFDSCECLNVHIAILFTMLLSHVLSPNSMLHGTMLPIPKGKWATVSSSDNFKAITLVDPIFA